MAARHVGRCPGLVDEHQALGIEIELAGEPGLAPDQNVWAILLGRVSRLLWDGPPLIRSWRFELKSEAQLDAQILHRARTRLVGQRTALINQLRAVLIERGIVVAKGRRQLEMRLAEMLDPEAEAPTSLSARTRLLIEDMRLEWGDLDRRIADLTAEFIARAREDAAARRLVSIPGVGALNATALVAAIGTGETFQSGRDLAAWLGLVPRQATTGGKPRLLGITKRGNTYLRTLLIHGARAALPSLSAGQTAMGEWLRGLIGRAHKNKVVVALAGKLARIAWAVLRSGENYAARAGQPIAA